MKVKDYDRILEFFGSDRSVFCCIRKYIGDDNFNTLLKKVNPKYSLFSYNADLTKKGEVYFMCKTRKTKGNCVLVKIGGLPLEINQEDAFVVKAMDVKIKRDKYELQAFKKNHKRKAKAVKAGKNSLIDTHGMSYEAFLKSDYWKTVRQEKLRLVGHSCQICGSTKNLCIHHRTYKHHHNELNNMEDLIVLCKDCHDLFHKNKKLVEKEYE